MPLGKFSLREVRARPSRVLLTFMSIAIGVAAVVAVLLATSTARLAQTEMLQAVSGDADLEILADGTNGFPDSVVLQVREVDGVEVAAPSITRFAVVFVGERKARTQVLGVDPRIDQQVRDYRVVQGHLPEKFTELMLDASFAESLDAGLGDTVKILARGGLIEYQLVGLVNPSGTGAVALSSAAYLVLPAAQSAFKAGRTIDQIQLKVAPEADVQRVHQLLAVALGPGVTIRQPRTSSEMTHETLYATENGLQMAIAFALLIAMFIIYNTFQMAVGERRRQLGILRAIGATRKQVEWMILREALWISVAASVAGCLLGVWGAGYLNGVTEKLMLVELPHVAVTWPPFVVAVVFGIGVSLLGALLPAKRAGSVDPMEAMRAIEIRHNDEVIRRTKPLGFVMIPSGGVLLWMAVQQMLPVGGDVVALVLILLGCVLLIPVLLEPLSMFVLGMMSRWLGTEALLARKQLMRHVGRSTLTVGVLFIAISTTTGMAGNILDNVENVRQWYARAIIGDFFVRASMPDLATGSAADMPDGVAEELLEMEGIEDCIPMRFVSARSGEDNVLLVVGGLADSDEEGFDLVEGTIAEARQGLRDGKAVIGSVLAQRAGLKVGQQVAIETEEGTAQLEIAGVANDYIGGGLTIHLDRPVAAERLGIGGTDAFVIHAQSGQLKAVEARLKDYCSDKGLILQSYAELVTFIDGMIQGVIASLWMLLGLGCVIATLGLVNTLTMNILEQTREIGMLRVVAMTRGQVRRMIFAQATLLGLLGLVPGAVAGVLVAFAIGLSSQAVLGHSIAFHFRPGMVIGCLAMGIVMVMLSSLIPAERAARLKLASALHYE